MSDQFQLNIANTREKKIEVLSLAGVQWGKNISPENFAKAFIDANVNDDGKPQDFEVYYLAQKSNGKPVSSLAVKYKKAFFKDAARSAGPSTTPDTGVFGIKNATFLVVTVVVTAEEYRKLGLANKLISQVIEHVEQKIVKEELAKSDDKVGSFKNLVTNDGKVDNGLVNYHLGKKYFWSLYSGIDTYYERFGFKGYPLKFYKVPTSILDDQQYNYIDSLLQDTLSGKQTSVGKNLRLLSGKKPQDRELISFYLQGKELEVLTELNKSMFHSELAGGHKSTSSMTNITSMLAMTQITPSAPSLSDVAEDGSGNNPRRKSSTHQHNFPKVAYKPTVSDFATFHKFNEIYSQNLEEPRENLKFENIEGAILTNELQQKSHVILWATVVGKSVVISIGELKFDSYGVPESSGRRRGSSFAGGLNELGGYNFQDLDILFSVASKVAKDQGIGDTSALYVSFHDLPPSIPAPVLNDYFLHYLPKTFEGVQGQDSENQTEKVEFIENVSQALRLLPMIKRFGSKSPEFELDWVANGMLGFT